jgi:hypothetical protein
MHPINFGAKVQFEAPADTFTPLMDSEKLKLQQVIGCLLYCARAVDPTMRVALNTLASAQAQAPGTRHTAHGTAATAEVMHQLQDPSDMVLQVSSDPSYLSESEPQSRTGGYFYLSNNDGRQQQINGPILCLPSITKHVMTSAAEAEVGSIFINAKEAAPLRVVLE